MCTWNGPIHPQGIAQLEEYEKGGEFAGGGGFLFFVLSSGYLFNVPNNA